jgi:hypothetical protein
MTHTVESLMALADRYVQSVIDDKARHTRETLLDLQTRRAYLESAIREALRAEYHRGIDAALLKANMHRATPGLMIQEILALKEQP